MSKIWNLRLILDELNVLHMGGMSDDWIRSELWTGLVLGCNGIDLPEAASKHLRASFEMGSRWRGEAENHASRMSEGGKASVIARRTKSGTAQPSKVVRGTIELPSEGSMNQSTSYKLKSSTTPRKKKVVEDIPLEFAPYLSDLSDRWPRYSLTKDGNQRVTILRPIDIWSRIVANRQTDEPKTVVNAGLNYLDLQDGKYIIGMDNFFGQKRKYTQFVVED